MIMVYPQAYKKRASKLIDAISLMDHPNIIARRSVHSHIIHHQKIAHTINVYIFHFSANFALTIAYCKEEAKKKKVLQSFKWLPSLAQ